jgi:hypothetical protein
MEVRAPDILTVGIEMTFPFNVEAGKDNNFATPGLVCNLSELNIAAAHIHLKGFATVDRGKTET